MVKLDYIYIYIYNVYINFYRISIKVFDIFDIVWRD